jgi:hypothetical protein
MHGGDGENELLIVEWKTGLVEMVRILQDEDVS